MTIVTEGWYEGQGRGRYRVIETLESSANSVWYKAFDEVEGRTVAIKVPGNALLSNPESWQRYVRAITRAGRCHHPNILSILDINQQFTVHEYFPSRTLDSMIRANGKLAPQQSLAFGMAVCRGLEYAHHTGLVHSDLRPHNVLVDETGERLKIRDFATSRVEMETSGLSRPGELLGGLYYIAPEQIRGERLDGRADIYALGIMLFEMLTGDVPYRAENAGALLQLHLTAAPRSPRARDATIPAFLDAVVVRCLEKDPADRYQTVQEVMGALAPDVPAADSPPADTSEHDAQGVDFYQQGDYALAISAWERSLELNPRSSAVRNNLGCALAQVDRADDALECFERALVASPENSLARQNAGATLYRVQRFKKAAEEYRAVVRLDPTLFGAWLMLGRSHLADNDPHAARTAFERAHALEPQNADAIYQLANAHFLLDHHEEAGERWSQARALDPGVAERKHVPPPLLLQT